MQVETIAIGAARLECYVLKESSEFQTGRARPALVLCPGGGYLSTSDREAEPVALWFAARGYHVFVLRYSVKTRFPVPMVELGRAVETVRARAEEWRVDAEAIALCGFSAGGHLAAWYGTHWHDDDWPDPDSGGAAARRVAALVLCYPVIDMRLVAPWQVSVDGQAGDLSETMLRLTLGEGAGATELAAQATDGAVSADTPPTFLWHTRADPLIPAGNSLRFAAALDGAGVPYELHVFERGAHGLSLATEVTDEGGAYLDADAAAWPDLAERFLRRRRG